MRRLVARQLVTLTLDGEEDGIDCHVRSVAGTVALLEPAGQLPTGVEGMLSPGSFCMMAFTHHRSMVALRGVVTAASEDFTELAFVLADGVQLAERRSAPRLALVTRVSVAALTDGESLEQSAETFTVDISLGGVLIQRPRGLEPGRRFRLALFLGGDAEPLRCEAELARQTPTHFGLRFTDMQAPDRARLAAILAAPQLGSIPPGYSR